jgi:CheY-like chemotaxis protein
LECSGYRILEAANGSEALRSLEEMEGQVQLLLTDLVLPDMTGTTLSQQIAARWPRMKVLYVSGYTENVIVHRGVLDPGKSFLQKPYSKEVLLNRIRELLA